MTTENNRCVSCLQRDTVEQDGYAEALSDTTTQLEEQNGVICALKRLNRRIPNGTYGGVRGRLSN